MSGKHIVRLGGLVLALGLAFSGTGCRLFGGGGDGPAQDFSLDTSRLIAKDALTRIGEERRIVAAGVAAVQPLANATQSGTVPVKQAAVRVLGTLAHMKGEVAPVAVKALVDIYMKKDPVVYLGAAVALEGKAEAAMPQLAALVAKCEAGKATGTADWVHPLSLMVHLDKGVAIESLINLLSDEGRVNKEGMLLGNDNLTLTRVLRSATQQYFGYSGDDDKDVKQASIERWRSWWKANKGTDAI